MGMAEDRAALIALGELQVDVDLPDRMRADGVDDHTVGQAAEAVELALAALDAQAEAAQAQSRADAAASDPDDDGAAAAAQSLADDAASQAAALAAEAAEAAQQAVLTLDRRHGAMAAAVAEAGGSARVASIGWYDQ